MRGTRRSHLATTAPIRTTGPAGAWCRCSAGDEGPCQDGPRRVGQQPHVSASMPCGAPARSATLPTAPLHARDVRVRGRARIEQSRPTAGDRPPRCGQRRPDVLDDLLHWRAGAWRPSPAVNCRRRPRPREDERYGSTAPATRPRRAPRRPFVPRDRVRGVAGPRPPPRQLGTLVAAHPRARGHDLVPRGVSRAGGHPRAEDDVPAAPAIRPAARRSTHAETFIRPPPPRRGDQRDETPSASALPGTPRR